MCAPLVRPTVRAMLSDERQVMLQVGMDRLERFEQFANAMLRALPTSGQGMTRDTRPNLAVGLAPAFGARRHALQISDRTQDFPELRIAAKHRTGMGFQFRVVLEAELIQQILQLFDHRKEPWVGRDAVQAVQTAQGREAFAHAMLHSIEQFRKIRLFPVDPLTPFLSPGNGGEGTGEGASWVITADSVFCR